MKHTRFLKVFFRTLLLVIVFTSCQKDEFSPDPMVLAINEFIWENMNEVYLWNDYIPQNIDLRTESDPEAFFQKLLFKPTDRWSFIVDDYDALVNRFKGIKKSFGYSFKLYKLPNSNGIIGIVKYVVPNSPAAAKQIKRGDILYKVNGITLTTDNYQDLLFENENYTVSFGEFNNNGQLTLLEDKSLQSVVITEYPILIDKSIDFEGYKIGYLSYNQFINEYEDSLINVFSRFQSEGIQDLVLDLRYNPGGSISTAILLSSMIAPSAVAENREVFSRLFWNEEVTTYFLEKEGEESDNLISRFITPEINLDLNRIYILISSNSASASELVINCLRPYMEVVLIGSENTSGKFVGSITVNDEDADHNWAIQPIVLKTANANGVSDYGDGFTPDYLIEDDFNAALGSLSEDMLAKAVELITGLDISENAREAAQELPFGLSEITIDLDENKKNMYFDMIN